MPLPMLDGADQGVQDLKTCLLSRLTTRCSFSYTESVSVPPPPSPSTVAAGVCGRLRPFGRRFLLMGSRARRSVTGGHFIVFRGTRQSGAREPEHGLCRSHEGELDLVCAADEQPWKTAASVDRVTQTQRRETRVSNPVETLKRSAPALLDTWGFGTRQWGWTQSWRGFL
ncbi:hypothetical protein HJG60_009225 [Phyllostomus discolor]|uniref:Uncharacterized protein n=1 Tax=Phyllostomus discolor TaxID=89673 RepID=A0A834DF56_9CHIR|nr:hypothetical protein HJG60_009225 [Phyllostomus discolor]